MPFAYETYNELYAKLSAIQQEHILRFWTEIDSQQRQVMAAQIEGLDFDLVDKFVRLIVSDGGSGHYQPGTLEPVHVVTQPKNEAERSQLVEAKNIGEDALRKGQVGVILVAGGQGTRLNFDAPKGTFPVGPVSGRSLFQYHTEKVLALERRYGCAIPFHIMTSEATHEETLAYFDRNEYFGKDESSFVFFRQGALPAFDAQGKMLLSEKWQVSMSPDGHGGLLKALAKNHLLQDMQQKGVETLFYFQVDNVLIKIADPVFIGFHLLQQAEMSAKTVYKRDPDEKIGHIGKIDGRYAVVEYTELSEAEKNARNADGRLKFGQGSIAIHAFSRAFLQRLADENVELPYHLAHKKIPFVNDRGQLVNPLRPNGFKFEQFIFDALPLAHRVMVMETTRSEEFAPIKDSDGEDSPKTARQALSDLFGKWLEHCGHAIRRGSDGHVVNKIEISPLFALDEKELGKRLARDFAPDGDILLAEPNKSSMPANSL